MGEALLKVLLVDDEPFILQGLKILIDWEQEGFEVVKTAANGEEALEYLRGEQVDLIIADIKMPVVTGLELLEKIRGEKISDAHFVILSGYADFEYARKAIRYDCTDYILKPVDREELLKVLNKVQVLRRADNQKKQSSREMEQAYLSRHLIALIQGKFDSVNLNINYLLFQLIHLASEQDDGVNQEEILRLISESSFEKGVMRGSKAHLTRFACEYGDYLSQLRKNVSRGVLGEIEREIRENYAKNITLKSLSEKYYVNSAYLGQLFRKKNGQSFKDYLNNYRMERAADLLLHTDKKIVEIAEEVGYHDLDYFVNRFILVKGCTPAKFRREA